MTYLDKTEIRHYITTIPIGGKPIPRMNIYSLIYVLIVIDEELENQVARALNPNLRTRGDVLFLTQHFHLRSIKLKNKIVYELRGFLLVFLLCGARSS